jgi:hypothetical protein
MESFKNKIYIWEQRETSFDALEGNNITTQGWGGQRPRKLN